jgi:hypothetical protein
MAKEKDLVLGADDGAEEFVDIIEETRLNMAEAREAFLFLQDYNEESAWVLQNRYKGAVIKARRQLFEIILQATQEIYDQMFPKQTDSPQP